MSFAAFLGNLSNYFAINEHLFKNIDSITKFLNKLVTIFDNFSIEENEFLVF